MAEMESAINHVGLALQYANAIVQLLRYGIFLIPRCIVLAREW
jgi:hypothetical protein